MSGVITVEARGATASGWWRSRSATRVLLAGGIAAGVLYVVGDLASGLLYGGYSFRDQAISELTAFGSPVRPLMVATMLVHTLPILAFAVALWRTSERPSVRGISVALVVAAIVGIPNHTIGAMSSRWMETGFNDVLHQTGSSMWGIPIVVAILLSAVAYKGWFRVYAVATVPVILGFAMASVIAMTGLEQNHTPWAGAFERASAYGYFVWLAVLAVVAMRRSAGEPPPRR